MTYVCEEDEDEIPKVSRSSALSFVSEQIKFGKPFVYKWMLKDSPHIHQIEYKMLEAETMIDKDGKKWKRVY